MELEKVIDETFVVKKTLGSGYTSKVVLATHKDGMNVAVKIFQPMRNFKLMTDMFKKEVDNMTKIRHENLINIIAMNENGVSIRPGKEKKNIMYMVLELAENAELFDFIADVGKGFSEDFARKFFLQLISGLKSMHDAKMAHRDLKTENLFLDGDFNLKIGDFGFTKYMDPNQFGGKLKTQLGTSGYQCPELLEGSFYSGEGNDIFACGVILFILINAFPPFREGKRTDNWYRHIYYGKTENFWAVHTKRIPNIANLSSELKDLISGMLRYKERFTLDDILKHSWMKGAVPDDTTFKKEMLSRKNTVDSRKDRELNEKIEIENQQSGGKVYRGEDEDVIIDSLQKKLEGFGSHNFPVKRWGNFERSKNLLTFNGVIAMDAYMNIISALVNSGAEIEVSEEEFSMRVNVPQVYVDEETKEKFTENVEFCVSLFINVDKNTVVADFIKTPETNMFSFKEVFDSLRDKFSE